MAFGCEILRSDGTYWLTPDQTPLNMVRRDDVSYPNSPDNIRYYDTGVPTSRPCCIFMRVISGASVNGSSQNTAGFQIQRNGTWQFQMNGVQGNINVRWYVFSNYVAMTQPYDIAYYNAAGEQTWNGSSRPLQMFRRTVTFAQAVSGAVVLDAGQPVAVIPTFSGDDNIGSGGLQLMSVFCFKALGNRIYCDESVTREGVATGLYVNTYFYINTMLYDL